MTKENLKYLLTDLYQFYNPEYIKFVDDLVDKYHRLEYAAVEMIIIKYNHRNSPYFDVTKSTDTYILNLIKEYDSGNRILKDLIPEVIKKEEIVKKDFLEENTQKLSKEVDEKIEEVKSGVIQREKELKELIQKYEKVFEDISEDIKKQKPSNISHFDAVDIKINLFYTESEIKLPNKEILASLGVGSRILVINAENKPIGLEVKDITYDCVSNIMIGGKPTLEITLERG